MTTKMNCSPPKSIEYCSSLLQLNNLEFNYTSKKDTYTFIRKTTWNLKYLKLNKKDKGIVLKYLSKITGYSYIQTKKLVLKACQGKLIYIKPQGNKTSFKRIYSIEDISYGHIYNLRRTKLYKTINKKYTKTTGNSKNLIGIREKPRPDNRPGFIRVDSVHGGDKDYEKGVYYVNFVDEVTQSEIVVCVEHISERFLLPVWEQLEKMFPFQIQQFHSDNGSEFINKIVSKILNTLNIRHSKSRPRHSTDNGLVECKNGWVIRKHFGYIYIEGYKAPIINEYLKRYFNNYLNFHRPCGYPTKEEDRRGKIKVIYKTEDYKTPYEKLKEIDPEGKYLREGINYEQLNTQAYAMTDLECMKQMNHEYVTLKKLLIAF